MAPGRQRRTWLVGLVCTFALALGLRLALNAQFERHHPQADLPGIDEASYDSWGREIASGEWLGKEIFFQEPLYPYWLGLVYSAAGDQPQAQRALARRAQAVLGAVTAVLVALLARRLAGAWVGLLAGVAWAAYRPAIWMSALLLKPSLFLPLWVGLLLLGLRAAQRSRSDAPGSWRAWFPVGLLAGLGALLRGNVLLLLPFVVAWPLVIRWTRTKPTAALRAWRSAAAILAGVLLVLLPVAARNAAVGGRFVLTTSGAGTNFYGGNNLDNPFGLATEFAWVRGIPAYEAGDWQREAERRSGKSLDAAQTSSFWLKAALKSMRQQPLAHAKILWNKLRLSLGRYEVPDNHYLEWDARHVPMLAWPLPGFESIGLLGLAGMFVFAATWLRKQWLPLDARVGWSIAAVFTLYLGTIVATVTSERVRLALVPLLVVFAAWFCVAAARRVLPGITTAIALFAGAALTATTPLPESRRQGDFDERDYNLASAWLVSGRDLGEIEKLVQPLEAKYQGSARIAVLAAQVEFQRARAELEALPPSEQAQARAKALVQSSLARLDRAVRADSPRERFRAYLARGAVNQYFGQWESAAGDYKLARQFDASDAELRHRLAVCLAETAMAGEASNRRSLLEQALELLETNVKDGRWPASKELLDKLQVELRRAGS